MVDDSQNRSQICEAGCVNAEQREGRKGGARKRMGGGMWRGGRGGKGEPGVCRAWSQEGGFKCGESGREGWCRSVIAIMEGSIKNLMRCKATPWIRSTNRWLATFAQPLHKCCTTVAQHHLCKNLCHQQTDQRFVQLWLEPSCTEFHATNLTDYVTGHKITLLLMFINIVVCQYWHCSFRFCI